MSARAARRIEDHLPVPTRQPAPVPSLLKPIAPVPIEAAMHPDVYRIALSCWVVFLAIFWMTFWISTNALFMVVIATFYGIMFFGVPYMLLRQVPGSTKAKGPLLTFLGQPFATNSGSIQGYEALLQVILVPLCLILGGTAIGFIIHSARAAH
jgi:hypothetical protein